MCTYYKWKYFWYLKVVLENSYGSDEHECPFAESSIELVKLLADILGIAKIYQSQFSSLDNFL